MDGGEKKDSDTCYSMAGHWRCYLKWNKPVTKIQYCRFHLNKVLDSSHSQRQTVELCLSGAGAGRKVFNTYGNFRLGRWKSPGDWRTARRWERMNTPELCTLKWFSDGFYVFSPQFWLVGVLWPHPGRVKLPGQGSNPHQSSNPSRCSDNTGSLTCCVTKAPSPQV